MNENRCIAIFGGDGLLGSNWAICQPEGIRIELIHRRVEGRPLGRPWHKLTEWSTESMVGLLQEIQPTHVVNAVALTNVDECEKFPAAAVEANALLAARLCRACVQLRLKFVHISSDQLFDGECGNYIESDPISPINVYGLTKALAERLVLEIDSQALIIRTNFFGYAPAGRSSLSDWVLAAADKGESKPLFTDSFFTPIYVDNLVACCQQLLNAQAKGVYHVVGDQRLSKYEFGIALLRTFGKSDATFFAGRLSDQKFPAPRPRDMSLCNDFTARLLGTSLGDIDRQLRDLKSAAENRPFQLHRLFSQSNRIQTSRSTEFPPEIH